MTKKILITTVLILMANYAQADSYEPSTYCSKPYKPYEFNSQWELDAFQSEVDEYRRCIEDFVDEQENAIRQHQYAIETAIDEWNSFVRWELN